MMKFLKNMMLCCLFFASQQTVCADVVPTNSDEFLQYCCFENKEHYATAAFSGGPDIWYMIDTNSYPDAVALSKSRNKGFSKGRVYLSPTGVTIGEQGDYWVNVTAILQNLVEEDTPLIPVFLVADETFDPDGDIFLGGVVSLPVNMINTCQFSGILRDIPEGARLSIVATNAGNPEPQPVQVVSWSITLFKMP